MAERRCLSKSIIESDDFYSLPPTAQAVYVHLVMSCDDVGFISGVDQVVKMFRKGRDSVQLLLDRRFLISVNGQLMVKHWRMMNSLKNDRKKPIKYPETAKLVWIKQNNAYTEHFEDGYKNLFEEHTGIQVESKWNPNRTEPNLTEPNLTEPNRSAGQRVLNELWDLYPEDRRGDQEKAYKMACDQIGIDRLPEALENLKLWVVSERWTADGGRYIPYLVNWISRGQWQEKPKTASAAAPARRQYDDDEIAAVRAIMGDD